MKRPFKTSLSIAICFAIILILAGITFLVPKEPFHKDMISGDVYDWSDETGFDGFISALDEQIGGGLQDALDRLRDDGANSGLSLREEDEEDIILDGQTALAIDGMLWRAVSIFTADYSNQEDNTYQFQGRDARIVVTLALDPSSLQDFSLYHLADSLSTNNIAFNDYLGLGIQQVRAYVYAYALGYGGEYYDHDGKIESIKPNYRLSISRYTFGGFRPFEYATPTLPTAEQFDKWGLAQILIDSGVDQACLLATYTNTLSDYVDQMGLGSLDESSLFKAILLGTRDGVVLASESQDSLGYADPGYPCDDGSYAYDNEYLVLPYIQLDIAKTYVGKDDLDIDYMPEEPADPVTYELTLDFNDGTGRTETLSVTTGERWPTNLTVPTRLGYDFTGYYSDYGGKTVYYYDEYCQPKYSLVEIIPGDFKLYASWERITSWTNFASDNYAGGKGTQNDPYQIKTPEQLAKLAKDISTAFYEGTPNSWTNPSKGKFYVQKADIDLSEHRWEGIYSFAGTFDGNGYSILNLNYDERRVFSGLFSSIDNATIKNVHIKSGSISCGDCTIGAIVSDSSGTSIIENCINEANINFWFGGEAGGIVGSVVDGSLTVRSCLNFGNIKMMRSDDYPYASDHLGGIIGIISKASVVIEKCINTGNISSAYVAGGIVGYYEGTGLNITECSSVGALSASEKSADFGGTLYSPFAGLVAQVDGASSHFNMTACSITGTITVAEGSVHPFCGYNEGSQTVTACYAYVNNKGYYTTALSDANWSKYWTISPAINYNASLKRNLPVKKSFLKYFWIGDNVATKTTTQAEFSTSFSGFSLST